MSGRGGAALLAAALLAGCAAGPHRPAGPPLVAVAADDAEALAKDFRADFRDISADAVGIGKLDPELSDHEVRIELPAEALFEQGNAQLKVAALKPLSDIASAAAARGACVLHVVGLAANQESADLAERRAASVAENFSRHSIAPARLRHESRVDADKKQVIVVALRLVVIGREPEAWMPAGLEK